MLTASEIRDRVRSAEEGKPLLVEVPEWGLGEPLRFRPMTANDLLSVLHGKGTPESRVAMLVAQMAIDAQGGRVFEDADAEWIERKDPLVLGLVFGKLTQAASAAIESIEARRKNSAATTSEHSPSSSLAHSGDSTST